MPSARTRRRKTAREKLDAVHPSHGRAFRIPRAMRGSLGKGTMIVPRPTEVEAAMRLPRKGKLITLKQIRARLARAARVDQCCPLTTASSPAWQRRPPGGGPAGKARITPCGAPSATMASSLTSSPAAAMCRPRGCGERATRSAG